jgi:hypothetical protein
MSAPSFITMPRKIRQKILGYAFQNAIHLDLLLHHHQLHHSHASALLATLTTTAKALQENAQMTSMKSSKRMVELVTTIAAMSLPLAEDCHYIIDMW